MPNTFQPRKGTKVHLPYGGLTKLAKLLGVTPSHLSHYLKGRESRKIDNELMVRFGLTREDLVASHTHAEAEQAEVRLELEAVA
jgi:predicted transcriptional regulator